MKTANLSILLLLLILGGSNAATAADGGTTNVVTLDVGEVWQGSPIEPCVYLRNTSTQATRVRHVQPPRAGSQPLDVVLGPGEVTIQHLPTIDTSSFAGPLNKTFLLLVEPPVVLAVGLIESCDVAGYDKPRDSGCGARFLAADGDWAARSCS